MAGVKKFFVRCRIVATAIAVATPCGVQADGLTAPVVVDAYVGKSTKSASIRKVPVRLQGESGLVIDKLDGKGRILSRMVSWGDKFLIAVDRDGDGSVDQWEMISGRTRIKMSAPTHGHFNLMDIDFVSGGERLQLGFQRAASGDFDLRSRVARPIAIEFEEARQGSAGAEKAFEETTDAPLDVRKRILAVQEGQVQHALDRVADPAQCGRGEQRSQNLSRGVARVVMSAAGEKAERGESYLPCLRDQGFEVSAGYISSRFFPTSIPKGKAPVGWSLSCPKCDASPGARANPLCGRGSDTKTLGAFQAAGEKDRPRIALIKDAACKDAGCEPSEAQYARTFQHEMLHMSGVRSEGEIEALAQCCAPAEGKARNCAAAERQARVKERAENYLQLYFHLGDQTRQKADQICASLPPVSEKTQGKQCPISYLKLVADEHQQLIERNAAGACKDESSADCRKLLKEAEAQAFKADIAARCESIATNGKTKCQESAESLGRILGVTGEPAKDSRPGEKLDLSESTRLAKLKGPVIRHQLPTGQMERDTVASGKQAAENMAASGGAVLVYSPKGPKMPENDDGLTYRRNPERIRMMVEASVGKQVELIDGIVSRIGRVAGAIIAADPLRAAQALSVQDPSLAKKSEGVVAVGQSLRVKRLLTHRAGSEPKAGAPFAQSPADARKSSSPAPNAAAKEALIKTMTSLGSEGLNARLKRRETLKALSDHRIGVIDETGERRDRTADPVEWLIYDEESGQLRPAGSDEK